MTVSIDLELCNGCGKCSKACPYGAIELKEGKPVLNVRCTSCGACIDGCRVKAITSDVKNREIPDFSDREGVWVFAEQNSGILNRVSLELLGVGQTLAACSGQKLSAVLFGHKPDAMMEALTECGAQQIYVADHESLAEYRSLPYTRVMSELILEHKPSILLIGATHLGRDLAPRVSMRVGLGLTADCTELSIDAESGRLLQTRPAFGGNVMATIVSPYTRPQMATVRPGVMQASRVRLQKESRIIRKHVSLSPKDLVVRILSTVEKNKTVSLGEAKVVVACGRGVGSSEGMKLVFSLAETLGAEVAGSRVAVEQGWIGVERQVGQTGQVIRPDVYIACGISGAIQHRVGMTGSKFAIAINKDRRAPIFQAVDWGIVGDLFEVIPVLTRFLKEQAG